MTPIGEVVLGPDQLFWDFQRGNQVVGFDWDVWMQFMIVAKSEVSEPLVHEIAAWLSTNPISNE